MVDAAVERVSRDDPPPLDIEEEPKKEVAAGGIRPTTKRRIASLDSPFTEGSNVSIIGKRLYMRCDGDFLLGESDVVLDIPDDDSSNLSKGIS